jgi:hypothetical protein
MIKAIMIKFHFLDHEDLNSCVFPYSDLKMPLGSVKNV